MQQTLPKVVVHVCDCDKVESRISFIFSGAEELLSQLKEGTAYYSTRLMCKACTPPQCVACGEGFSAWKCGEFFGAPDAKQLALAPNKVLALSELVKARVGTLVHVGGF